MICGQKQQPEFEEDFLWLLDSWISAPVSQKVVNILLLVFHYKLIVFRKGKNRSNSFQLYSYFYRKGNIRCILYQSPTVLNNCMHNVLLFHFSLGLFYDSIVSRCAHSKQISTNFPWSSQKPLMSCYIASPVFNQIIGSSSCIS